MNVRPGTAGRIPVKPGDHRPGHSADRWMGLTRPAHPGAPPAAGRCGCPAMRARGVRCEPEGTPERGSARHQDSAHGPEGSAHASSHRGAAPAQEVRGHRGGRRRLLHRRRGRDLRDARPQRRGQDDDRGVHRGPAGAGRRRDQRARARPPPRPGRADPAARRPAAGQRAARPAAGGRGAGAVQLLLPRPGRLAGPDGDAGAHRQGQDHVRASCPAARSSGCRSRWRWSAARGWRCSTSSRPAWTRRPGATPGS